MFHSLLLFFFSLLFFLNLYAQKDINLPCPGWIKHAYRLLGICVPAETFGSNYTSWNSYSESAFPVFFQKWS